MHIKAVEIHVNGKLLNKLVIRAIDWLPDINHAGVTEHEPVNGKRKRRGKYNDELFCGDCDGQ